MQIDMTTFEDKYGIKEHDKTKAYHKSRRMFAIKNSQLFIADEGVDYSHAEWFKKLNWITEDSDVQIEVITRGAVEPKGVFFYVGYDFKVTSKAEDEMMRLLPDLVSILKIPTTTKLFGGKVFDKSGITYPVKEFGSIRDHLKVV